MMKSVVYFAGLAVAAASSSRGIGCIYTNTELTWQQCGPTASTDCAGLGSGTYNAAAGCVCGDVELFNPDKPVVVHSPGSGSLVANICMVSTITSVARSGSSKGKQTTAETEGVLKVNLEVHEADGTPATVTPSHGVTFHSQILDVTTSFAGVMEECTITDCSDGTACVDNPNSSNPSDPEVCEGSLGGTLEYCDGVSTFDPEDDCTISEEWLSLTLGNGGSHCFMYFVELPKTGNYVFHPTASFKALTDCTVDDDTGEDNFMSCNAEVQITAMDRAIYIEKGMEVNEDGSFSV